MSKRNNVSPEMRRHPLVVALEERLGDRLKFTTEKIEIGELKADTIRPAGFSLRVNSPQTKTAAGTTSVMDISAGRECVVGFPSTLKLRKYLPDRHSEIDDYESVLRRAGLDISEYRENQHPSLKLEAVLEFLDELSPCLMGLAGAA